ncbi:transcription antitermination factor NusB [Streptobacillus moniliformis]|uniref:Transcription antitermination protein NusB n=1 Tax=Streptobacillus moniliformis (strain ATCC 14647 / DSM 12112 / NCTC 10651 / 9901) TaxID=519441 RepID=D1AVZ4_STRM9|nr:transcription antitermination factor NusB [Streptobacillus moniliformis]ACZ01904.1 NusB antitermination factor [Streptobacillus moniliformis DSM 12112]AVL43108.1 transcription antitermination factor NusB [Streptobacillus moniliformis]QXW65245.1 transcription antitermination factor NusB [Streptobacillus moniliformis]SQA12890.1 N utilization substance protein B homolog [Streptobacillus moniliformis]
MTQREVRNEIFKILFEHEVVNSDIIARKDEVLETLKISNSKREFLENYLNNFMLNESEIIEKIKEKIKGWTFSRLATPEKVILKMAFFEILFEKVGHEIVINEAVELSKVYGDEKTKTFINGILADLIKDIDK